MPEKGNTFRKNSKVPNTGGRRTQNLRARGAKSGGKSLNFSVVAEKTIKITGLFLLLLSVFFLIAFTSYLFTWQEDQSYVSLANGGWNTIFMSRSEISTLGGDHIVVQNWMGKLGALLANQLIYKGFGVASFLFIGFLFLIGYRLLFKVKFFSTWKIIGYTVFSVLFLSISLGFIHSFISEVPHFLEGEFGFWTNRLLEAQIGVPGVGGLLLFTLCAALIIIYNIDFKIRRKKPTAEELDLEQKAVNRTKKEDTPEILADADYELEPVEFNLAKQEKTQATNVPRREDDPSLIMEVTGEAEREGDSQLQDEVDETPAAPLAANPTLSIETAIEEKSITANKLVQEFGEYDPKLDLSGYKYPGLDLLTDYGSGKITINNQELEANKDRIVETLGNYNIEIAKIKATIGPTVTLYEIIPKPGVRISRIKNLEDDIALSLAALGIRIIAPMPGKGTIGIEVPNSHPEMVSMRSVLATEKFQHTTMDLPIALGKTISNEVYIADLAKMPHLLVAGATGQGKSVGINAILTSLLYKKHPAELKFVLVDPKKVELSLFKKIERHFLAKLPNEEEAIITDTKKVINTLNSLCIEMDLRYDLLKNAQVRNLKEYNVKFVARRLNPEEGHRFLPFIVLIIDEFADLMMTAGKEIENPIARLAQLARAVGIHLVIATQRPSVNIITGTIKANFPARLAFRVLSKVDSRTILDSGGADQLIGRGDMLLATGSDLIRIQCAFVDTPEVDAISDYIGNQRGYPSALLLPEVEDAESGGQETFDSNNRDPLFEEAARLIVQHQQGSTSLIQRRMKLGYNRAGRIIDQLEAAGIVGPFEGSKAREVLYPDEYALEQYLNTLK